MIMCMCPSQQPMPIMDSPILLAEMATSVVEIPLDPAFVVSYLYNKHIRVYSRYITSNKNFEFSKRQIKRTFKSQVKSHSQKNGRFATKFARSGSQSAERLAVEYVYPFSCCKH